MELLAAESGLHKKFGSILVTIADHKECLGGQISSYQILALFCCIEMSACLGDVCQEERSD